MLARSHGYAAIAALGVAACGPASVPADHPAATYGTGTWDYDVTASPGATDLSIEATFPPKTDTKMLVVERADIFLVGVEVQVGKEWHEVRRMGASWTIPECEEGCHLRYRYLLGDAVRSWNDVALGIAVRGAIEAPPSTWLLRPEHAAPGTHERFHVKTAPGDRFVTGVFEAPGVPPGSGVYDAVAEDFFQFPYSAFGQLSVHELGGGSATLAMLPGELPEARVVEWAESALAAVKGFYGRPSIRHVAIFVRSSNSDEVGFGSTMGYSGAAIVIEAGSQTTKRTFERDWVLVHELVHTALPDLPDEQHWLEEGLATYVEPLARYRSGALTAESVWGEWALRMHKGEPEPGDEGLDNTHTWGRTYWGGALFCLAADVEIRTRTQGKASLETALRAVLAAGGDISVSWPTEKFLSVGDKATGTTVLHETYERLAKHPTPVDLPTLWKKLGVVLNGETVTFDDHAELAWVRLAMTPPR